MPTKSKTENAPPTVYKVEEVAKLLRLGRSAAYDAVNRGEIPSLRFGRRLVVPRAAFDAMLQMKGEGAATG